MKRYRINLQINKNKVYECFYVKSNHSRTIIDFLNSNQPRYFLFLDSFNFLGNFCFHYYFSSVLFLSLPFVYRSKLERPNVTLKYFASQITLSYCFVNIINVHTQCGVQFLNAQKRFTPIHIIPLMVFLAIYRLLSSISFILNISQYFIKKKILNFEERQIIILINNFLLLYSIKKKSYVHKSNLKIIKK